MSSETRSYEYLLASHLLGMVERLRLLSAEQFDYTPSVAAPTPRILATHTLQWLICDRYHIEEPDAAKHPRIPDVPDTPGAMADALQIETDNWRALLRTLTPEQLDEPRHQFNIPEAAMTVRGFVCHIIQNSVYKNGQFATLFFALGLDGTAPYTAPFPNPIYTEVFGDRAATGAV